MLPSSVRSRQCAILVVSMYVRSGAYPEFRAKGPAEIRRISEAAIRGDIRNASEFLLQQHCRSAQAHSEKVLMGRRPGQSPKGSQEVVRTKPRNFSEPTQIVPSFRL
jgi:hypothetical protein